MIAHRVTASSNVEVGEIARVGDDRDGDDRKHDESKYDTEELVRDWLTLVAFVEVCEGERYQEVEEGEYGEEMAETDGEIAGDTNVGIEENKEH